MPQRENKSSDLLTREENEMVFSLIGPKCQSLATAVVQLFITEGPGHSEWKKKDTGVLCLIKDNGRRSYFFRIYCLNRKAMIWEHEVYMQIEYKNPRPYLHTFEAEEYMTAFNFANEDEARHLRKILIEKIEQRKQRREERRNRSQSAMMGNNNNTTGYGAGAARHNGAPPPAPAPALAPHAAPPAAPAPMPKATTNFTSGYGMRSATKKPKTRKLTKADIGVPLDFKHVSHVGWDANKGFDVENLPEEEMRSFFSKAGISDKQLEDQETRQFIYDFINMNGGLDAVKEELHDEVKPKAAAPMRAVPPAPPVPARSPAPPAPPAPPSRAPPPPPSRAVPPPPTARNPPPPRPSQPPSSAPPGVPPPPPPGAPPPPPPPPPPVAPPAAPPPPPMPKDAAVPSDARAALMESIRSGNKTLKKVELNKPAVDDSRSNLLSEIRQGVELRSVTRSSSNSGSERKAPIEPCGLAGALARALKERNRAIHSDSDDDDSDDETTSDGEWDE